MAWLVIVRLARSWVKMYMSEVIVLRPELEPDRAGLWRTG